QKPWAIVDDAPVKGAAWPATTAGAAVLGGRYQVTGRVMASAQPDQVLTGIDQVLTREVLSLVASTENAAQAAQSARQLATGERASSIPILAPGLSAHRPYLANPGNSAG